MTYLICPLHNEQDRLKKFISRLNTQTEKPFIIFIDSGDENVCETCAAMRYEGKWVCERVPSTTYWAGSLKVGQGYMRFAAKDDIVCIANNDTTFSETFFECMTRHCKSGVIVASNEDPKRILWHKIWTRAFGAISTIHAWEPNALSNRAVFMMAEDFLKVKFYPRLLPHYCSDFAWTYQVIKSGVEPYIPLDVDLSVDESTTGITEPKTVKELFSIRCPHNPIYYTIFILMCAPWKWKLPNLVRVFGYAAVRIWRMYRHVEKRKGVL